jgi:hypothetical protein
MGRLETYIECNNRSTNENKEAKEDEKNRVFADSWIWRKCL